MKRLTPTPIPEPLPVVRMHCPKCETVIRIYRVVDTYPIKLPGCCPFCLSQILSYTPEVADES